MAEHIGRRMTLVVQVSIALLFLLVGSVQAQTDQQEEYVPFAPINFAAMNEVLGLPHEGSPDGIAIGSNQRLASKDLDGRVHVWDIDQRSATFGDSLLTIVPECPTRCFLTALAMQGNRLAVSDSLGSVWLYDAGNGALIWQHTVHESRVAALVFDADGTRLASVGDDGRFVIWEAATGQTVSNNRQRDHLEAAAFSPDGRLLAFSGRPFTQDEQAVAIHLLDTETNTRLADLTGNRERVAALAFSPDGQLLAATVGGPLAREQAIRIWDMSSNTEQAVIAWESEFADAPLWATSLAFTPDGEALVAALTRNWFYVWPTDALVGRLGLDDSQFALQSFIPFGSPSFTPDGKFMATCCEGVTVFGVRASAAQAIAAPAQAAAGCFFTTNLDDVPLFDAPLSNNLNPPDTRLTPFIQYAVSETHFEHFHVTTPDGAEGWVDRRSGVLEGACDNLPEDETPLREFPSLCWFDSARDEPTYGAAGETDNPIASVSAGNSYVVLRQTSNHYLLYYDHAFSAWVAASAGTLSGDCATEQRLATTLANARIWSAPNVRAGSILATLDEGQTVAILGEPVSGPLRLDQDVEGDWYPVETQDGSVSGWLWAGRLVLDGE